MMKPIEKRVAGHLLRIAKTKDGWAGIVVGDAANKAFAASEEEVEAKLMKRLDAEAPGFVGPKGARRRFLEIFPDGFADPSFIGGIGAGEPGEGAYKRAASDFLQTSVPLEQPFEDDAPILALRAIQKTNLIDRYAKARLADVLGSPRGHDLLGSMAAVARDGPPALSAFQTRWQRDDLASWPVATYLAFLWRPDEHCFLKPEVSKAFAEMWGHRFAEVYTAELRPAVYEAFLDLVSEIGRLTDDLRPADNIDLHGFLWAAAKYTDEDVSNLR